MADDHELLTVLQGLRTRGALGETSLPSAVRHAEAFVAAIPPTTRRVIDLGSGGGLPGLVLAMRLPHVEFVLTDRRERRTDLLRMACSRLGLGDRVAVLTGDVVVLARDSSLAGAVNVVTARAFGEPAVMLPAARPFLAAGGVVVVSEPPELAMRPAGDIAVEARWPASLLTAMRMHLSTSCHPGVRVIEQTLTL